MQNAEIIMERVKFITKYNIITKYVNVMCIVKYCTIIEFEYCCLQKISQFLTINHFCSYVSKETLNLVFST